MSIVTVWTNPASAVKLCQLSDDPADGTAQEQIAHLATLSFLNGWSCVDQNYTGPAPETDAFLWRWSDGQIVSLPAPDPQPTIQQVAAVLQKLGMTQTQLDSLFAAASKL